MDRRNFVKSGLAAGVLGTTGLSLPHLPGQYETRRHYELRTYELRNDINGGRLRTYLKDALLPAYGRAGAGTIGVFTPDTGLTNSVMLLVEYPSMAAVDEVQTRLDGDSAFSEARRAFETNAELPFIRYDAHFMRAFAGHPRIEVPPGDATRPARMFELRTYEARTTAALERKIAMFNEEEITLFRSIGMTPVFFGENIFGTRLPSLTYMLTFEDMAARMKAWATFGSHPEWQRINKEPRFAALGSVIVSNVSYLKPVAFSAVR